MIDVITRADGLAIITINRPEKANAIDVDSKLRIAEQIDRAAASDDVRAVIVTGAGSRHFCAGSDVRELAGLDHEHMIEMIHAERAMYVAALRSPKPVIAAVNGHAFGAGLLLVICCDYAVAAEAARFAVPELSLGATTPVEGLLLPWIIGLGWARALYFTGKQLDAEEAMRLGIVHDVTPADFDSCLDRAIGAASHISGAPDAFKLQKQWMYQVVSSGDLDAVIEESVYAGSAQLMNPAVSAAARSFLVRRKDGAKQ